SDASPRGGHNAAVNSERVAAQRSCLTLHADPRSHSCRALNANPESVSFRNVVDSDPPKDSGPCVRDGSPDDADGITSLRHGRAKDSDPVLRVRFTFDSTCGACGRVSNAVDPRSARRFAASVDAIRIAG